MGVTYSVTKLSVEQSRVYRERNCFFEPELKPSFMSEPDSSLAKAKLRFPTFFWARAEPGSDLKYVTEPSQARSAQTFLLKLAQALASFLHFVGGKYYKLSEHGLTLLAWTEGEFHHPYL